MLSPSKVRQIVDGCPPALSPDQGWGFNTSAGKLLPLPLARLPPLLSLCLSLLVIHATSTVSTSSFPIRAPVGLILDGLREQGIDNALGCELLALYGSVARKGAADSEEWVLEMEGAERMVRETGRGLLMKLDVRWPTALYYDRLCATTDRPSSPFHRRTSHCR